MSLPSGQAYTPPNPSPRARYVTVQRSPRLHSHRTVSASPQSRSFARVLGCSRSPWGPQGTEGSLAGEAVPPGPAATWEGLTHSAASGNQPAGKRSWEGWSRKRVSGTRAGSCAGRRRDACLPQSHSQSSACPGSPLPSPAAGSLFPHRHPVPSPSQGSGAALCTRCRCRARPRAVAYGT